MLKKIRNMKCKDLMLLTTFANLDFDKILKGENPMKDKLKYERYLYDSSIKGNENVEMDVSDIIDDLMFDNYDVYLKLKERVEDIDIQEFDDDMLPPEVNKAELERSREDLTRYVKLYERLLLESKFDYASIRSVQKLFLQKRMTKAINTENYELCIELQEKMKVI